MWSQNQEHLNRCKLTLGGSAEHKATDCSLIINVNIFLISSVNEVRPDEVQKLPSALILSSSNTECFFFSLQAQLLFQKLLSLKSRGVKLKIVSSRTNVTELKALEARGELLPRFNI